MSLALSSATAFSQQAMTMDSCMSYAAEHSSEVELQRIEARQSRVDYRSAVASFLPTVSAAVNAQYGWGRGIDPETNTYNNVTTFNNYYQLNASLAVFDGFQTLNSFRKARLARRNSQTAIAQARDAKAIEVMQCYVDAVYARASIRLASEKLAESRRVLQKTQRMFDLGSKARPDVAQAEAQVAEDDYNLTHQHNEAVRTMEALKKAMNFPADSALSIDTAVAVLPALHAADDASLIYESFSGVSPELRVAQLEAASSRYSYLASRADFMPRLTLNGGIETSYYKNLSQGGAGEPFGSQFKNNRGEYLSLTLSIPIFQPSTWRSVRRAKSDWQAALVRLEDTRRKLRNDIRQAVLDRDGYAKEMAQMDRKAASDSLAHHLDLRKYEEGMLSTFELRASSQKLLESRIKLLQMRLLYGMKQRLVDYYKGVPLVSAQ